MRTIAPVLLMGAVLLAGCQGDSEPADPPSSQDSLTTATLTTSDAAPTTEAPGDDVEQTTAPSDTVETTEASGPPVMPEEAHEDSEAGAAAFATYYLDTLNYSTESSTSGLLQGLAAEGCETCSAFEALVDGYTSEGHHTDGPVVTFQPLEARDTGETMVIFADATQPVPSTLDKNGDVVREGGDSSSFTLVIRVTWSDDGWQISEIQAGQ